jgi:hypothetical protein
MDILTFRLKQRLVKAGGSTKFKYRMITELYIYIYLRVKPFIHVYLQLVIKIIFAHKVF